jgi:hypothetical protein
LTVFEQVVRDRAKISDGAVKAETFFNQ